MGAVVVMEDMTEQYMMAMVAMEGQLERLKQPEDLMYMIRGHVARMTWDESVSNHHSLRPR